MKILHAYSLDFDRCLKRNKLIEQNLSVDNAALTEYIRQTTGDGHSVVFVGSNRQDKQSDYDNDLAKENGSCFQAIKQYAEEALNAKFNPLLLADIYGDLPAGESLHRATNPNLAVDNPQHPCWLFDREKITILYAQVHELARKHPDKQIVFEFFDDDPGILTGLFNFFDINRTLIPQNITLKLNQYDGRKVENNFNDIVGEGDTDYFYRKTIKFIAKQSNHDEEVRRGIASLDGKMQMIQPSAYLSTPTQTINEFREKEKDHKMRTTLKNIDEKIQNIPEDHEQFKQAVLEHRNELLETLDTEYCAKNLKRSSNADAQLVRLKRLVTTLNSKADKRKKYTAVKTFRNDSIKTPWWKTTAFKVVVSAVCVLGGAALIAGTFGVGTAAIVGAGIAIQATAAAAGGGLVGGGLFGGGFSLFSKSKAQKSVNKVSDAAKKYIKRQ